MTYLELAKAALKRYRSIYGTDERNELRTRDDEGTSGDVELVLGHEKNEVDEGSPGAADTRLQPLDDGAALPDLIAWFKAVRAVLPRSPFLLRPGCRVIDSERYYARLDDDISRGESGVRWKAGLSADLESLRRIVEGRRVEQ